MIKLIPECDVKLFVFVFTESLIESALSAGVIEIMKDYIVKFSNDEDVILMVLLAVGSLADSGKYLACIYSLMTCLAVFLHTEV